MKKHLLVMMCLLFSVFSAIAQTIDITGVVRDEAGEPVIGATVTVKGTSNAVATDGSGVFALSKISPSAVLTVQYLGSTPIEVEVNNRKHLTITMSDASTAIEAVVATGYGGKQLRSKVTNSIATVDNEVFEKGTYANPAQALPGTVSGLRVSVGSGTLGEVPTITLRNGTNLDGSGSPLIIVDGQLRSGMNDINSEDIESMEVLKDAGATALYGARASNGVILITTKTGKAGSSSINVKARVGVNFDRPIHEFLGAEDYIYWMRTAYTNNSWAPAAGVANNINTANPMGTGNDVINDPKALWNLMFYDQAAHQHLIRDHGWQTMIDPVTGKELVFKDSRAYDYNIVNPTVTQDYNLNVSGGNNRGTYYAGFGYYDAKGQSLDSFYKRFSATFNGSYKVTDFLTSETNFSYNRANWQELLSGDSESNYYARTLSVPPTMRWEDEEGNMLLGGHFRDGNQQFQNDAFHRFNQTDKFTMIQTFKVDITDFLQLRGTANWYYSEGFYESFNQDYYINPSSMNTARATSNQFSRDFSQTYNAILDYNQTFNKHTVGAMAGYEYYYTQNYGFSASGSGAPTDNFQDLGLTDPGEGLRSIDSWHSKYAIASVLGRVSYDYDSKYLFSAVFRYDGYSSLLGDNRWGFFPGVSTGWVFGREDFIADAIPALSFGKLRASFGLNGNASSIGAYTLQGNYGASNYNGQVGYLIGTLPNPSLQWEKTRTFEVGLDVSFFKNRLNANVTFFNRLTYDKHAALSLPSTTGFSSITNNNGSFRNNGIEIDVNGTLLNKGDWNWTAGFNITYSKNMVISLPDNDLEFNRQGGQQIYAGYGSDELVWVGGYQEGQEPGVLVGYVMDGVFNTDEELKEDYWVEVASYSGKYSYSQTAYDKLTDEEKANAILLEKGDIKYKDINGDGKIDIYDQIVIGNTIPRWYGGINTTVSWKGLSLYVRADFALDYWLYDYTTAWIMDCAQGTFNTTTRVFDSWTPENPTSNNPRYTWASFFGAGNYAHNRQTTYFAYRADYIALREVSLSYSLPKNIVNKIACQKVEVSVSGQNLGYLTAAKEVATPEKGGVVHSANPVPTTVMFGLSVTF